MHRIDSHNAVPTMPPPEAPEAEPGYFSVGDPSTVVSAAWCNEVQEEIISVLTAAGIEPTKGQLGQMRQAITAIIAAHASVTGAQAKADSAYLLAAQADTKGGSALTAASDAQETADAAEGKAEAAQETADDALVAANNGITMAGQAMDYYVTIDDPVDADDYYDRPRKLFVTGEHSNFPEQITAPLFFNVMLSENVESITQNVWDLTGGHIFTRCATTNLSDGSSPMVTWSPWNSVAVPEVVKSVEVVVDPANQPEGTYLVITVETETGDQPVYLNLTQLVGEVYQAGNNGVTISADHKIGLRLSATPGGLSIESDGLKFTPQLATTTTVLEFGQTGTPGSSTKSAREDHTHTVDDPVEAGNAAISVSGTAVSLKLAAQPGGLTITDDGLALELPFGDTVEALEFGGQGSVGTAETAARSDHVHPTDEVSAGSVTVKRGRLVMSAELASGSNLALGESYIVGANRLLLFFDNVLLEPGATEQYVEVGTVGGTSQTVQVKFTLPVDSLITYVIFV